MKLILKLKAGFIRVRDAACNGGMNFYLDLKPHSDGESVFFACLAFCLIGLCFYINTLP